LLVVRPVDEVSTNHSSWASSASTRQKLSRLSVDRSGTQSQPDLALAQALVED
jgi:hypothetical protein